MEKISFSDFKKLDLRVAKIIEAREHPNADKLYVLEIDTGEEKKQIIAGIRQHYSPDDLIGRKIVVVNNMEAANIRGEESNGMLLAASSGEEIKLIVPECDIIQGSPIK